MPSINAKTTIKSKTYYFIEALPNPDDSFIVWIWKVRNAKNEEFKLINTKYKYTLYDMNDKRVAQVNHITER